MNRSDDFLLEFHFIFDLRSFEKLAAQNAMKTAAVFADADRFGFNHQQRGFARLHHLFCAVGGDADRLILHAHADFFRMNFDDRCFDKIGIA